MYFAYKPICLLGVHMYSVEILYDICTKFPQKSDSEIIL